MEDDGSWIYCLMGEDWFWMRPNGEPIFPHPTGRNPRKFLGFSHVGGEIPYEFIGNLPTIVGKS